MTKLPKVPDTVVSKSKTDDEKLDEKRERLFKAMNGASRAHEDELDRRFPGIGRPTWSDPGSRPYEALPSDSPLVKAGRDAYQFFSDRYPQSDEQKDRDEKEAEDILLAQGRDVLDPHGAERLEDLRRRVEELEDSAEGTETSQADQPEVPSETDG